MSFRVSTILPDTFELLPFGEKLMLWAMRSWVQAHADGDDPHVHLVNGFKLAGAIEAYPAFHQTMIVLVEAESTHIGIRFPQTHDVSQGEHRLLMLLGALQQGAGRKALNLFLAFWIPPSALVRLHDPVTQLAEAMLAAGLSIRTDHRGLQRAKCGETRPAINPPIKTLH